MQRYVELLLRSFGVFVLVVLVWTFGLALIIWHTGNHAGFRFSPSDALTSFFSVGGSDIPVIGYSQEDAVGRPLQRLRWRW